MANNLKLEDLISTQRLSYYKDINEHFDNLIFISKITPKLAIIEICIRNILDKQKSTDWIINSTDIETQKQIQTIQSRYENNSLQNEQYLSNLTLGHIVYLIKNSCINHSVFFDDLSKVNFKKYCVLNHNYYRNKRKGKTNFSNQQKMIIILDLIVCIRNRSYHWENMKKTRIVSNNIVPRISVYSINKTIGIMPNKIEAFLDDILDMIHIDIKQKLLEASLRKNQKI